MDQGTFNKRIGELLRSRRRVARLTQDALASSIGVSRATIANIETGRQAMSTYQLMRLVSALNLSSLDDLLDSRTDKPDDGGPVLFRAPRIAEHARRQVTDFVSRHGS